MVFPVIKLLVIIYSICSRAYGLGDVLSKSIPKEKDMKLGRQLQFLNRTSVIKTIQLEEGDIIDCIDIKKQPALDHPLLKNHKVQMRPTSFPSGIKKSFLAAKPSHTRPREEACPFGAVPIHRSPNDDSLKTGILAKEILSKVGHFSSMAYVRMDEPPNVRYRGAFGSVSVYNPIVEEDQASSAIIWVRSLPPEQVNLLAAGWMVSPELNDDDKKPRLFISWEGEGNTGCVNMLCKGFVQVDQKIGPQYPLNPVSTYGGKTYDEKFTVFQDRDTGNWWLAFSEGNVLIGYWPKEIVPRLKDGASRVAWGGVAWEGDTGISPPMGSGHKPDGNYNHAVYFRQVHYIDSDFVAKVPIGDVDTQKHVDEYRCYDLRNDGDSKTEFWGYRFTFGGPGGFCGN